MSNQKVCQNCQKMGDWFIVVRDLAHQTESDWCLECHDRVYFLPLTEMLLRGKEIEARYQAVKRYIADCQRPEVLEAIDFCLRRLGARLEENPKHPTEELCINSPAS